MLIEVTDKGRVASCRNYKSDHIADFAVSDERVTYNHEGQLILVRQRITPAKKIEENDNAHEFYCPEEKDSRSLPVICIDQVEANRKWPFFAYTGEHFSWVSLKTKDKNIKIFNLRTRVLRLFDPSRYMTCPDDGHTLLNSTDPVQLLTLSHALSPD